MSIQQQGVVFSATAWVLCLGAVLLPVAPPQSELLALSIVIFLFGVPHGALDTVYARQLHRVESTAGWAAFGLAYLAIAALVVGLWVAAPVVFLIGFLLISALHFSGDPQGEAGAVRRVLYGGSVLICPVVLHAPQVRELYSMLAGAAAGDAVVTASRWMAWPWMIATAVAALRCAKNDRVGSLELVSVAALMTLVSPVLAFTMFFCGMHSLRHAMRTHDYARTRAWTHLLRVAAPPMLVTGLLTIAGWQFLQASDFDIRLVQLVFVGLAALTVPHMILVERVRFSGWTRGNATSGPEERALANARGTRR